MGSIRCKVALILCLFLSLSSCSRQELEGLSETPSSLALGSAAKTKDALEISLIKPVSFLNQSRSQVIQVREQTVALNKVLLAGDYHPSAFVFGKLEEKLPWLGLGGQYIFGKGPKSVLGPAYESKFILNPFLLIDLEFWGLTGWGSSHLLWIPDKVNAESLKAGDLPLYCKPQELIWYPAESRFEVRYDVTSHIKAMADYTLKNADVAHTEFGLIAYNARDFGYRYIWLNPKKSENITGIGRGEPPFEIADYIRKSYACGPAQECNHHKSSLIAYEYLKPTVLPVMLHFHLWKNKPFVLEQVPDLEAIIRII